MATSKPSLIPQNSLILVTGVNGLIASHIADQFLAAGYRVRGTVRSIARAEWLDSLLKSRYGEGHFQLVEVPDINAPGVYDAHLDDVVAVANVAGTADLMVSDVDKVVEEYLKGVFNLLNSAKARPNIKSVVLTSSAWAAYTPVPNVPMTISEWTYNEAAVQKAASPNLSPQEKGISPFMAVRTKAEKAEWEWVAREKPHFNVNCVLPDTVLGPILDAEHQSASTSGFVKHIWNADPAWLPVINSIAPQWYIDVRDNAKLYLGALTTGMNGRRIFGFADRYSYHNVLEILKKQYPEKKDFPELQDLGWDQADVPTQDALEVLRSVGQQEWTSLEQSVRDTAESFITVQ